jgi:hypothetical protein
MKPGLTNQYRRSRWHSLHQSLSHPRFVQHIILFGGIGARCALAALPPQWRPPIYAVPQNAIHTRDLGIAPDSLSTSVRTDVTASLQKALDSLKIGQTLYLDPGAYHIDAPLFIRSGTSLQGSQDHRGDPLAKIVQTVGFQPGRLDKLKLGVLMNADYAASTITDTDITITAVAFVDQSAGVLFRMARNIRIQGCSFNGGGDGTAFLASQDIVVTASLATNTRNAAYDYWDGVNNATVEDSFAFLAGGYGISFNAADTDGTGRIASEFAATDNVISGAGNNTSAIYVDPLGGDSKILGNITIIGNQILSPQPNTRAGGIFVSTGDANVVTIQGNLISGSAGYLPILVAGYRQDEGYGNPGQPVRTVIMNNTLESNIVAAVQGALIRAEGREVHVNGNVERGNASDDGRPIPFVRSVGRVHAWDNQLTDVASGLNAYNVPPGNLTLQAPSPSEK